MRDKPTVNHMESHSTQPAALRRRSMTASGRSASMLQVYGVIGHLSDRAVFQRCVIPPWGIALLLVGGKVQSEILGSAPLRSE